jgi:superfamily I DNA/RNA helicase
MREFEERFITLGLPYKVIGGPRFYERAEIRDALAFLRCVAQPDDDLAFERIFNVPKRGLGEATLSLLHGYARRAEAPLIRAAKVLIETEELKARPRQILRELLRSLDDWSQRIDTTAHHELAQSILEESGYIDMWKADRTADAAGRLENLKELTRSMEEFPSLAAFLEHVSLVMDAESGEGGRCTPPRASNLTSSSYRAGRRDCFPTNAPLMRTAARDLRKNAGWPMSASPGRATRRRYILPPTDAFAACGRPRRPRASSTNYLRITSK